MANINIRDLPSAAEGKPANVEVVSPPKALEAEMAQRSKAAELAGRQAMGKTARVVPPLLQNANTIPPAKVEAPTKEEIAVIKERAREHSNPTRGEFYVEPTLAAAADLIYNKLGSMSMEWQQKLDAMKVERGLRRDQIVFALIANSLDTNQHMIVPADHAYFSVEFKAGGTNFNCVICDQPQSRSYPGQPPVCVSADNKCANRFHAMPSEDQKELLEAAA
jgi:hypothetical protein